MHFIKKQLSLPRTKRLLLLGILFWVPIIIFSKLSEEVLEREPIAVDIAILQSLRSISNPQLDALFLFITELGGTLFIILAGALLIGALFLNGHKRSALAVLFSVGGAGLINMILKLSFQRVRPDLWTPIIFEKAYSFPSGHAMGSSALALSVIILLWRTKWRYLALIIGSIYVVLIGTSRVYLGVHYPSDVIGGWCISLVWVLIVRTTLKKFELRGKGVNATNRASM
ncbi:hypothetical protein CYG49_03755 [Candidatus Saccharibacteria bacterium]|nr:MAG: hypothetical protein CYG49_03755 [Candidatus Saccharibacteria bacterium]